MIIKEIKLYEDREDVTLTTYIIAESGELHAVGNHPAVIICPGGAYLSCSDREAEPIALKFAAMGYHAFVLRYSTYNEGNETTWNLEPAKAPAKAHCQHPAPMRELGKTMMIIKENAAEWQIDEQRIAVCGFSAGAHNAAMYATHWQTDVLSAYFKVDKEIFRPAAAILCYGLSDYIFMDSREKKGIDKKLFELSNISFLGEKQPNQERLREISPCLQLTEHMPPTFLWATSADTMVPVQHTLRMAHALADQEIPFALHIFEEGMHGLATAGQASALVKSQINKDAEQWLGLAEEWLKKRFGLKLNDKIPYEEML